MKLLVYKQDERVFGNIRYHVEKNIYITRYCLHKKVNEIQEALINYLKVLKRILTTLYRKSDDETGTTGNKC